MIPATPEPKIPEDGPEPEFRPEFFRNFEPSQGLFQYLLLDGVVVTLVYSVGSYFMDFISRDELRFNIIRLLLVLRTHYCRRYEHGIRHPSLGGMFSSWHRDVCVENDTVRYVRCTFGSMGNILPI